MSAHGDGPPSPNTATAWSAAAHARWPLDRRRERGAWVYQAEVVPSHATLQPEGQVAAPLGDPQGKKSVRRSWGYLGHLAVADE